MKIGTFSSISDSKLTLLSSFLTIFFGVVTSVLIARGLQIEVRGEVAEYLVYCSLVAFLLVFSLEEAVIKNIKRNPELVEASVRSLRTIASTQLLPFAVLSVVVYVFQEIELRLYLSALVLILSSVYKAWCGAIVLSYCGAAKWNYARILHPLVYLISLSLFVTFEVLDTLLVVMSFTVANVSVILVMSYWVEKQKKISAQTESNFDHNEVSAMSLVSHGAKLIIGKLSSQLSGRIDLIVVAALLSAKETGIYAVAAGIALAPSGLIASQSRMVFSKIALKEGVGLSELFKKEFLRFWFCVVSGTLFLILSFPLIMPLMYGEEYIASIRPAQIIISCAVIYSATMFLSSFVIVNLNPVYTTYAEVGGLIAILIFCYPLVMIYGIEGAAFLAVINCSTSLILMVYFIRKNVSIKEKLV